ncbi:sulfotransferase family protein [Paenibacillus ferrarius]|uniref:sulfotransferase family protein n=1 Tax=Paenibacillus ferrarius TaxID=1469647 RepID=UPI003D29ED08
MSEFNFVMISAGFEHGGNVTHRHLDGHPNLLVYPFESQLGNRNFNDFLASVERVQYRYPEFPEGLSAEELYEQIIDEEMKTFLRKRNGSKFREADLILDEKNRINSFKTYLGDAPFTRKKIVEAFFRSTFAAWENYYVQPEENMTYVGYSPAIGVDADRMVRDFPNIKIMHIVRNPFSAYRDTKRRPFPLPLNRYLITWNIYHSTVEMYAEMYPNNVKIFRYEDLVADKTKFMQSVSEFIGVEFNEAMLYPSWNGKEIKDMIAPWGTVLKSTESYNEEIIDELSEEEKQKIIAGTTALARHFGYDQVEYLKKYYAK